MKTVRRLFYRDIVSSVLFVALAFLSLFFFIDFVEELADVGKGYTLLHAVARSLLLAPGHLYELMPIAVLIGTIYALARLAQSSEYTILRTGGLGPGRALSLLAQLGLAFAVVTYVTGDWIAPYSERQATELLARELGADLYVMLTDADAVYEGWGTPQQRAMRGRGGGDIALQGHEDRIAMAGPQRYRPVALHQPVERHRRKCRKVSGKIQQSNGCQLYPDHYRCQ